MHMNIHYLYSKLDEIKILLSKQSNIDILCFCETFLHEQFNDTELKLSNYQLFRKDIPTNGGGLVMYVKNNLICSVQGHLQINGIEALWLEVKYENQKPFLLAYVYRPPSSNNAWMPESEESLEKNIL